MSPSQPAADASDIVNHSSAEHMKRVESFCAGTVLFARLSVHVRHATAQSVAAAHWFCRAWSSSCACISLGRTSTFTKRSILPDSMKRSCQSMLRSLRGGAFRAAQVHAAAPAVATTAASRPISSLRNIDVTAKNEDVVELYDSAISGVRMLDILLVAVAA